MARKKRNEFEKTAMRYIKKNFDQFAAYSDVSVKSLVRLLKKYYTKGLKKYEGN